jgi:hypothetical protein
MIHDITSVLEYCVYHRPPYKYNCTPVFGVWYYLYDLACASWYWYVRLFDWSTFLLGHSRHLSVVQRHHRHRTYSTWVLVWAPADITTLWPRQIACHTVLLVDSSTPSMILYKECISCRDSYILGRPRFYQNADNALTSDLRQHSNRNVRNWSNVQTFRMSVDTFKGGSSVLTFVLSVRTFNVPRKCLPLNMCISGQIRNAHGILTKVRLENSG